MTSVFNKNNVNKELNKKNIIKWKLKKETMCQIIYFSPH